MKESTLCVRVGCEPEERRLAMAALRAAEEALRAGLDDDRAELAIAAAVLDEAGASADQGFRGWWTDLRISDLQRRVEDTMTVVEAAEAILDGYACVCCGETGGEMAPIGTAGGDQIFAHGNCHLASTIAK